MCEANLRARGQPGEHGSGHAQSSGAEYSVMFGFRNDHRNLSTEKTTIWAGSLSPCQPLLSNDQLLLAPGMTFTDIKKQFRATS